MLGIEMLKSRYDYDPNNHNNNDNNYNNDNNDNDKDNYNSREMNNKQIGNEKSNDAISSVIIDDVTITLNKELYKININDDKIVIKKKLKNNLFFNHCFDDVFSII